MKKMMKRIGAVLMAVAMMAALGVTSSFAAPETNTHTIKITGTNQYVKHTYVAYKVFSGNLNAKEDVLSDIDWANGVKGTDLLNELKSTQDPALVAPTGGAVDILDSTRTILAGESIFKNCNSARDVALVLQTFAGTEGLNQSAGQIDAVASIIAKHLNEAAANFDGGTDATNNGVTTTTYEATVTGDGYYFIKDTTGIDAATGEFDATKLKGENGTDTTSKFLLRVIKDQTIVAKDTGLTVSKKTGDEASQTLKAGTLAVGDTAYFKVTAEVPNTMKYQDHFFFIMNDKLPTGITFTGINSVKIDNVVVNDFNKAQNLTPTLTLDNYNGNTGYYTLKVATGDATPAAPAITDGKYPWEATGYDAVKEDGGQKIELTFNEFKKFVETKDLIGKTVTVIYTGVVNDDANYQGTGEENEVTFTFSNEPNHIYDGDNPGPNDPYGVTPEDKTRHYTTNVKVDKVDENNNKVPGATFKLTGTALNRTILTGWKFVKKPYTATNGEVLDENTKYWKLKDGSYTTTDPNTDNINQTQYATPITDEYYKVTFDKDEIKAKETANEIVTNDSGVAAFIGLNEGTYTLEETASADGFNKIDGQLNFVIHWSDPTGDKPNNTMTDEEWANAKKSGGYWIERLNTSSEAWANLTWDDQNHEFTITVVNKSGSTLPSTGGIGTYVFTIAGVAIMAVAAGLLVIRHKKKAE